MGITPPTIEEVFRAAHRHRRLSEQFAMLSGGIEPCPVVAGLKSVNIDPVGECVYLSCRAIIQRGSADFRISDPFGYGFSDVLEKSYRERIKTDRKEEDVVLRLKKRARTVRIFSREPRSDWEAVVVSTFGEDVRSYGELFGELCDVEYRRAKCIERADSSDKQAERAYDRQRLVQSLYAALEWSLRYTVTASSAETLEGVLGRGTYQDNGTLLRRLAHKLGLEIDSVGPLLEVPPGAVQALREGTVEMRPLLALAIAGAANDPHHRFRQLASQCPDWLVFLRSLKGTRDASAHGCPPEADDEKLAFFRQRTYDSLRVLLPRLRHDAQDPSKRRGEPMPGGHYDERLKIRIALEERFGVQGFALLDSAIAELLIQVEMETVALAHDATDTTEAIHHVVNLAAVLQHLVHRLLPTSRTEPVGLDGTPIAEAAERACEAGFTLGSAQLPSDIASVNLDRVRQALTGLNPSLGACLVAFLLAAQMDQLQTIAVRTPNLVILCGRLVKLRGHGNQSIRMLPQNVLSLKDDVYHAFKAIMEV
ncbi:MAG: hypothetical protein KJ749_05310, partial [Planctomycetes bacterium]|nr:hypothetical protein [Planctomycetota bacterium]